MAFILAVLPVRFVFVVDGDDRESPVIHFRVRPQFPLLLAVTMGWCAGVDMDTGWLWLPWATYTCFHSPILVPTSLEEGRDDELDTTVYTTVYT